MKAGCPGLAVGPCVWIQDEERMEGGKGEGREELPTLCPNCKRKTFLFKNMGKQKQIHSGESPLSRRLHGHVAAPGGQLPVHPRGVRVGSCRATTSPSRPAPPPTLSSPSPTPASTSTTRRSTPSSWCPSTGWR